MKATTTNTFETNNAEALIIEMLQAYTSLPEAQKYYLLGWAKGQATKFSNQQEVQ